MYVKVSTISLDQCSIIHIRTYSSSWRNWSAHRPETIWKSVLQTRLSRYRNVRRSALISYLNWEDSMRQTEFQDRSSYTESFSKLYQCICNLMDIFYALVLFKNKFNCFVINISFSKNPSSTSPWWAGATEVYSFRPFYHRYAFWLAEGVAVMYCVHLIYIKMRIQVNWQSIVTLHIIVEWTFHVDIHV